MIQILTAATWVSIDGQVWPKNVLTYKIEKEFFTIQDTLRNEVISKKKFSEFIDNTNTKYISVAALDTALKAALFV